MPVDIDSPEAHIIRKMVPFSTMPNSIFKVICDKIVVENARSGTFLFKRGETAKELVYLLKGEVSLEVEPLKMEVIKAGSESARFALAHQLPRKVNGVAKGAVQFLRLNSIYITTPDSNGLKKNEAAPVRQIIKSNDQSRISTLFMIPILRGLPPAQLSKINECLEEVEYEKGEVITKQGDTGEYYYLIKSGECLLTHKDSNWEQTVTTTTLQTWDSFGAEELIDSSLHCQTATALTSLFLLRIKKANFIKLLKEPLLKFIDVQQMQVILDSGGLLLEISRTADSADGLLQQVVNIPLIRLRNYVAKLDKNRTIVISSDEEKISEAAAFLLLSYKFSVQVLKNSADLSMANEIGFERIALTEKSNNDVIVVDKSVIKTRGETTFKHESGGDDLLAAENATLRQQLKQFKLKCEKLELEKQAIAQKYQVLLKQFERLKTLLASVTKQ